ncbi:hypothetical protein GCM10027067_37530 [Pseudactinotalea suaedae]
MVSMRHGSICPAAGLNVNACRSEGFTMSMRKTATQSAIIVIVTTGFAPGRALPPKTVTCPRPPWLACRTQSTQCTPTAAGRWHSGHAGRPHRWQLT